MEDFNEFVKTHQRRVYNFCLRSCGNPDDAFDLSQEVFIKAWRGIDNFRGEAAVTTWLYRLAVNACADFTRKKARRAETVPFEEYALSDERYQPELVLEKKELSRALEDGMSRLAPEYRRILALREVTGLSYKEIGGILSLEEGTVKSRLARARLALREILIKSGNELPETASKQMKGHRKGDGRHGKM